MVCLWPPVFQKIPRECVSEKANLEPWMHVRDRGPDHDHIDRIRGTLVAGPTVTPFYLPSRFDSGLVSGPNLDSKQAGMALVHISAQRCGAWLAALLLLQAQQTFSLSHQILKDVDYPILPMFSQTLTVRTTEARRWSPVPKVGVNF